MKIFGRRKWKVAKTIWPYPEGYGTVFYQRGKMTIVDTGLTKEQAQKIVEEETEKEKRA